ncbi:extracellular matrix protein 14 [Rhizoctonia solani]|uniref:Extracellular matrix protein 14 n=1 Tax=Rhizoctonia solani TaxID=456999 RepID=A0A0K6FQ34_9AGAM|nr:extracellular matrix protein 14 [Rhizoctonia solani]
MLDFWRWSILSLTPLFLGAALAYPTQRPLSTSTHNSDSPANYTSFELRRYGISNHEDLTRVIDLVNQANIDIWHLTPSHVDVHTNTTASLPELLAARRYTTLPHSFPYNYSYHPETSSSPRRSKIDLSSLQDNEFHRTYHTYEEIDQFVVALASQYPELVEIVWLGASSEQRDVFAIRIGTRSRGGKRHKKHKHKHTSWAICPFTEAVHDYATNLISRLVGLVGLISRGHATTMRDLYSNPRFDAITQSRPIKDRVVIQGAQHAREWIATATALYVAHALVAPEDEAGSLRHLLDDFDFTIIPVPNPDGYAYTWTTDRLWYKNRMPLQADKPGLDECQGVDMNRNWGYHWNTSDDGFSGGPQGPCSHWYPGAYPFQAPEVTAIANYIRRTPKIRAFLDLRSYGQQLMYPYSYSCEQVAPHAENLIEAAIGATKALRETHGVPYTSGASCELLYPAPGNIIDWMYEDAKVKYSYSLMLRDTGTYGFLLPPRYIQPVGEETAAAVKSLAKFIENVGL